jgi:hypothetical protein
MGMLRDLVAYFRCRQPAFSHFPGSFLSLWWPEC